MAASLCGGIASAWAAVPVEMEDFRPEAGIEVRQEEELLRVSWPTGRDERAWCDINLEPGERLLEAMGVSRGGERSEAIARRVDPLWVVTIGQRDAEKAARGMVFFDNPRERPNETYTAVLEKKEARVFSEGSRVTVSIGELSFGSYRGRVELRVFRGSPLLDIQAVVSTEEKLHALLYDAGLAGEEAGWEQIAWIEPHGRAQRAKVAERFKARPLAVRHRVIAAEGPGGGVAVFPRPHQYFYPLDFANNYEFTWFGEGYAKEETPFGLGIRQPLEGDRRWVPWFDVSAGSEQRLSFYCLLSADGAQAAIEEAARFTRWDRFKRLPGHLTFTSHYHVEHSADYLRRQREQRASAIPKGLEAPEFVTKFKETGVDIVHLGEFHFGETPREKAAERLPKLKVMHEECERLSDAEILILPGEEPNVHLGGHWMSFFPRPVYWVLNRAEGEPFVEDVEGYGKVYRVGSPGDVLRLMELEDGLMWTAHARIKSSLGFPDRYKDESFFRSEHFLGAAWKAMPADLSRPTLGWRALDLLDDMNNWGARKQVLGEVDVFRVELDYELYAHMNINYLKMESLPRFEDGWKPVLEALRGGEFFTTTGEVLIPEFRVAKASASGSTAGQSVVEAVLEWTFPMNFAEVVMGDGVGVERKRIDLRETTAFGRKELRVPVDLKGQKWVRLEAWDAAANGAFTQPQWLAEE